ncbi:response regulator transcription factor [Streptomyces sp. NBC_00876]|uniref:response regulator n=1 Tax=Streptomyces sp. NBC_00876 TaxID=2975853 RepID=UPI00386D8F9F|nr:response regulator transcription factor [Streptomyces sp. NBC_00876]
MPDEISRSSGERWTQQPHVSQHTSSHAGPLSSPPTSGAPAPEAPVGFPAFPAPEAMPATRPLRVVVADDNPVVRAGLSVLLHGRDDIDVVAEAGDGRQAYEMAVQHRPDVVLLDVRMPGVDGISALPHLVRLAPVLMMTYSRESEIVHEALRLGAGGYLVHGEFTADQLVAAVRDTKEGRAHFTYSATSALLESVRAGGTGPAQHDRILPEGLGTAFSGPGYHPAVHQGQVSASAHDTQGKWMPSTAVDQHLGGERVELNAPGFPQKASLTQPSVGHSSLRVPAPVPQGVTAELSEREVEVMDLIASGMTNQQIAATCFISQKTVKNHINRIFAKLNAGSRGEAIAVWHRISSGGSMRHG